MLKGLKKVLLWIALFLFSAIANLSIKIIPFKKLIRWLTNSEEYLPSSMDLKQKGRLRNVIQYLEKIEKISPWRVLCFEQAICTVVLCRLLKLNVVVYFGIMRDSDNELKAHAWTASGGYILSGNHQLNRFTVVYQRAYNHKGLIEKTGGGKVNEEIHTIY